MATSLQLLHEVTWWCDFLPQLQYKIAVVRPKLPGNGAYCEVSSNGSTDGVERSHQNGYWSSWTTFKDGAQSTVANSKRELIHDIAITIAIFCQSNNLSISSIRPSKFMIQLHNSNRSMLFWFSKVGRIFHVNPTMLCSLVKLKVKAEDQAVEQGWKTTVPTYYIQTQ